MGLGQTIGIRECSVLLTPRRAWIDSDILGQSHSLRAAPFLGISEEWLLIHFASESVNASLVFRRVSVTGWPSMGRKQKAPRHISVFGQGREILETRRIGVDETTCPASLLSVSHVAFIIYPSVHLPPNDSHREISALSFPWYRRARLVSEQFFRSTSNHCPWFWYMLPVALFKNLLAYFLACGL